VGKGSYGLAAGAQGIGCCWEGCGDCEGDGGVSSDHIHLFIQYPPKYSVNGVKSL